jgi:hypothetical protein
LAAASIAILTALHGGVASAEDSSFFGPDKGFEIQPEVDVYVHVAKGLRLLLQAQETSIPSEGGYSSVALGGFVDWFVAPFVRNLISPNEALTHALNFRLGLQYSGTLDPGTVGSSQILAIQLDGTPRYFLPWSILVSSRNRLQGRWKLGTSDPFSFRYRWRLQVEREFDADGVGLTPFVNAEFIWQSPPAMWVQFRMQAGLQTSAHWFGRGQTFEVNYSTVTYLQPSRSWRPVLGIIWYQYF